MHEESPKRVLLVGATGCAGRKLAKYLLTSTDATVILCGRNRSKLGNMQSGLPAVDLSRQTELFELDAAHIDVAALPDFDLLVNATGTGRPVHFRLSMFHEDAYALTAVPTVAMIKQMLQGELQPGIHLMGLCRRRAVDVPMTSSPSAAEACILA